MESEEKIDIIITIPIQILEMEHEAIHTGREKM